MMRIRKRTPAMGFPAIVAGVFLAAGLGATEMLSAQPTSSATETKQVQDAEQVPTARKKGDLAIELGDARSRDMRCVSRYRETTCTGWPVAPGSLAYNDK